MAEKEVKVKLTLDDKDFKKKIKEDEKQTDSFIAKIKKHEESFRKIGFALTGVVTAGILTMKSWLKEFEVQERANKRLETIMTTVVHATREQIESIKELANEYQKISVIADDVATAGASQLASYALTTEQIKKLMPALTDLAVATYGVNVSQEQAIQTANMLGKALAGYPSLLKRVGIVFNDAQAEILRTGTQMERVNVLAEIIKQNYGGLATEMLKTTEGTLVQIGNLWGELKEELGEFVAIGLKPILTVFSKTIKIFMDLPKPIKITVAAFTMLGTTLATIGVPIALILGNLTKIKAALLLTFSVIKDFAAWIGGVYTAFLASPAAIAGVVMSILALMGLFPKQTKKIFTTVKNFIVDTFKWIVKTILNFIRNLPKYVVSIIRNVGKMIGDVANFIVDTFFDILDMVIPFVDEFVTKWLPLIIEKGSPVFMKILWEFAKAVLFTLGRVIENIVIRIINSLIKMINWVIDKINYLMKISSAGFLKGFEKIKELEIKEALKPKITVSVGAKVADIENVGAVIGNVGEELENVGANIGNVGTELENVGAALKKSGLSRLGKKVGEEPQFVTEMTTENLEKELKSINKKLETGEPNAALEERLNDIKEELKMRKYGAPLASEEEVFTVLQQAFPGRPVEELKLEARRVVRERDVELVKSGLRDIGQAINININNLFSLGSSKEAAENILNLLKKYSLEAF